ncbi:MAG: hypothetical protein KME46_23265 [Brasilonema angustatum HA4187-MV1]|jgi:hypothetical protein|nr:hypothetical protein [Brasilonema angustatum HA4187-MV1]
MFNIQQDLRTQNPKPPRNLTLPCRASLSLARRGKDFSAAKSEGEVKSEICVHDSLKNERILKAPLKRGLGDLFSVSPIQFNLQHRKFLFIYAIIPLFVSTTAISNAQTAPAAKSPQPVVQQGFTARLSAFWQRRPRHRLGARSGICAISPGLLETYVIWRDRPLFLWQGRAAQITVRDRETQTVLWTQSLNPTDKKIAYNGKEPLQPGKLYQWQLLGAESSSSDRKQWTTFQIMPAGDRDKIQADLQTLEQKLRATKASQEDIAVIKADYFTNYKIKQENDTNEAPKAWSDAVQTLYDVENPSPSFVEQRQTYVANLCTQQTTTTQAN